MKSAFAFLNNFEGLAYAPWPHWWNWGWTGDARGWGNIAIFWVGPFGFAWDTDLDA
jgi:hypothetical protein